MQLPAEAGAGKALNEQRLELVRSDLIAANAQRLQAKSGRLPFHLGWGGNRPGKIRKLQSQQPLADGWVILWFTNDQVRLKPQSLWLQATVISHTVSDPVMAHPLLKGHYSTTC